MNVATEANEMKARSVLVPAEGVKKMRDLREEFKTRTNGGKVTQAHLLVLGLKKLTIADLMSA